MHVAAPYEDIEDVLLDLGLLLLLAPFARDGVGHGLGVHVLAVYT